MVVVAEGENTNSSMQRRFYEFDRYMYLTDCLFFGGFFFTKNTSYLYTVYFNILAVAGTYIRQHLPRSLKDLAGRISKGTDTHYTD